MWSLQGGGERRWPAGCNHFKPKVVCGSGAGDCHSCVTAVINMSMSCVTCVPAGSCLHGGSQQACQTCTRALLRHRGVELNTNFVRASHPLAPMSLLDLVRCCCGNTAACRACREGTAQDSMVVTVTWHVVYTTTHLTYTTRPL